MGVRVARVSMSRPQRAMHRGSHAKEGVRRDCKDKGTGSTGYSTGSEFGSGSDTGDSGVFSIYSYYFGSSVFTVSSSVSYYSMGSV